jgi:hypothetical protein
MITFLYTHPILCPHSFSTWAISTRQLCSTLQLGNQTDKTIPGDSVVHLPRSGAGAGAGAGAGVGMGMGARPHNQLYLSTPQLLVAAGIASADAAQARRAPSAREVRMLLAGEGSETTAVRCVRAFCIGDGLRRAVTYQRQGHTATGGV